MPPAHRGCVPGAFHCARLARASGEAREGWWSPRPRVVGQSRALARVLGLEHDRGGLFRLVVRAGTIVGAPRTCLVLGPGSAPPWRAGALSRRRSLPLHPGRSRDDQSCPAPTAPLAGPPLPGDRAVRAGGTPTYPPARESPVSPSPDESRDLRWNDAAARRCDLSHVTRRGLSQEAIRFRRSWRSRPGGF